MYTLIGLGMNRTLFYKKTWKTEPKRHVINAIKTRQDNKYGAYLSWSFTKPEPKQENA